MTRYLVVLTADVEEDDPQAAYDYAVAHIGRYPAHVWAVPENLEEDPQMVEIHPTETE